MSVPSSPPNSAFDAQQSPETGLVSLVEPMSETPALELPLGCYLLIGYTLDQNGRLVDTKGNLVTRNTRPLDRIREILADEATLHTRPEAPITLDRAGKSSLLRGQLPTNRDVYDSVNGPGYRSGDTSGRLDGLPDVSLSTNHPDHSSQKNNINDEVDPDDEEISSGNEASPKSVLPSIEVVPVHSQF